MLRCCCLAAMLLAEVAAAGEPMSPQAFTREYIERIAAAYPGAAGTRVGELEVALTYGDDKSLTSYLDNAYARYKTDPDAVDEILHDYVRSLGATFSAGADRHEAAALVPVIKDNQYLESMQALITAQRDAGGNVPAAAYYERLNAELVVLYAFDSEYSMAIASRQAIEAAGVPLPELRQLAVDNLMARLPEITRQGDDTLSMLVAGGNFEASLLLVDALWNKDNFHVRGDIVAFVPSRDVLLVTGSDDADGLAQARRLIRDNAWSYMISPQGFVRRDGTWKPFRP